MMRQKRKAPTRDRVCQQAGGLPPSSSYTTYRDFTSFQQHDEFPTGKTASAKISSSSVTALPGAKMTPIN